MSVAYLVANLHLVANLIYPAKLSVHKTNKMKFFSIFLLTFADFNAVDAEHLRNLKKNFQVKNEANGNKMCGWYNNINRSIDDCPSDVCAICCKDNGISVKCVPIEQKSTECSQCV
jgi:hypothetical protein